MKKKLLEIVFLKNYQPPCLDGKKIAKPNFFYLLVGDEVRGAGTIFGKNRVCVGREIGDGNHFIFGGAIKFSYSSWNLINLKLFLNIFHQTFLLHPVYW